MADIRALEQEFTKTKSIETCIMLCEAYLSGNRFMEAMVVCKNGIKSAPDDPRGPAMLARVYLEQGKAPKAQQELEAAMQRFGGHPVVLETQGRIAMKSGNPQGAVGFLVQALQIDPNLQNARKWLLEMGVQPPAPVVAAPPQMAQQQMPQQAMPNPGMQPGARPPGAPPAMPRPGVAPGQQPGMMPQPGMQPGMMPQPGMQPGMMPQQAMPQPGMQPGMMPRPGVAPGQQPGMMPQQGMMPQPGMQPGMMPQPAAGPFAQAAAAAGAFAQGMMPPGGAPAGPPTPFGGPAPAHDPHGDPDNGSAAAKLEHVSDFFSNEALGFSGEASGVETAGPGRLTIVGFIPKTSGSLKTTLIVVVSLLAVAAVFMTYIWVSSKNKREINARVSDMLSSMSQDRYVDYKRVLELGDEVFAIDNSQEVALAIVAYAHAVLASEHGEDDSLGKAKEFLKRATAASEQPHPFRVAAAALIAYSEGNYDEGIAGIKDWADKAPVAVVQMEAFRLRFAKEPRSEETDKGLKKVIASVTGDARVLSFLGWHYYLQEDFSNADKYFAQALQSVRTHEPSLIGQAIADLERGIGLKERQKEIDTSLKKVFGLPQEELSQPVKALAHFARAQLRLWQDIPEEAKADFEKAVKLDPKNPLLPYRRGVMESSLLMFPEAVAHLKEANRLRPADVRIVIKLARAQIGAEDYDGAAAALKRGFELDANNPDLLRAQGDLLRAQKKTDDAIAAYKKLEVEKHGGKAYAAGQLGISAALREARKAPAAVTHMENFLKSAPAVVAKDVELQARIWEEMGLAQEAAGKAEKAEEAYKVGVEQFRYYADNHFQLCRILKFKGDESKEYCKVYLAVSPRGKYAKEVLKHFPALAKQ